MRQAHQLDPQEFDRAVSYYVTDVLLDIVNGNEFDLCEHHKDLADKIASFQLTPEERKKHDREVIHNRMDEIMEDDEVIGNHGTLADWVIDVAAERANQTLYHSNDTLILFDGDIQVIEEEDDEEEVKPVESKDKKSKELN